MLAIQKVSIIHFHVCENMKPNCFYILIVIIIGLLHSQSHQRNIIIIRHYMIKLFKQQGRICSICWFRFWLLLIKSIEKVMCLNQPYLASCCPNCLDATTIALFHFQVCSAALISLPISASIQGRYLSALRYANSLPTI